VRELKEGYAILEDAGINHIIRERKVQLDKNEAHGDTEDYCLLDVLLRAKDGEGNLLPQTVHHEPLTTDPEPWKSNPKP
jgi:hypothetical protein